MFHTKKFLNFLSVSGKKWPSLFSNTHIGGHCSIQRPMDPHSKYCNFESFLKIICILTDSPLSRKRPKETSHLHNVILVTKSPVPFSRRGLCTRKRCLLDSHDLIDRLRLRLRFSINMKAGIQKNNIKRYGHRGVQ